MILHPRTGVTHTQRCPGARVVMDPSQAQDSTPGNSASMMGHSFGFPGEIGLGKHIEADTWETFSPLASTAPPQGADLAPTPTPPPSEVLGAREEAGRAPTPPTPQPPHAVTAQPQSVTSGASGLALAEVAEPPEIQEDPLAELLAGPDPTSQQRLGEMVLCEALFTEAQTFSEASFIHYVGMGLEDSCTKPNRGLRTPIYHIPLFTHLKERDCVIFVKPTPGQS